MSRRLYDIPRKNFAIILAAGASTRMGCCKTSLLWLEGKTLLSYQVEQWLLAGIEPIVVIGPHNTAQINNCPTSYRVVVNPCPSKGKVGSLLTGLHSLPQDFEVLAISAVDQPRSVDLYRTLLQEHRYHASIVTAPSHQGRLGHPLFFSNQALPYLKTIREETGGLRQVIKELYSVIQKVEFNSPDIFIDLNTPENYQAIWKLKKP